ncbi:metal ABC transporter permease [Xinfangfangia pollutisoli]|uniref:metal ABC transporter permease n=1 Tax=Xinfangfangia pollutisoli TaxID=2865960 RepID=UPI001CD5D110|nr:metal ABC transporter permease [Xinfangfangia pollutisoli]
MSPLLTVALGTALLGGLAGALGPFAVLRRQSLMGDVLSHAALPGICIGFLVAQERSLPALLAGALIAGLLAAGLIQAIQRFTKVKPDAAMGIVLSTFFALGVVLLSYIQHAGGAGQAGLSSFLFGQAAAMLSSDVALLSVLALMTLALLAIFWRDMKLVAFDRDYARALGRPVDAIEALLAAITAVAIVAGLQVVGVVLMVALLIAPAVAARQWVDSILPMVLLSAALGAGAGVAGAFLSASARGLATGPVIVLVAAGLVLLSLVLSPRRGLLRGRK